MLPFLTEFKHVDYKKKKYDIFWQKGKRNEAKCTTISCC